MNTIITKRDDKQPAVQPPGRQAEPADGAARWSRRAARGRASARGLPGPRGCCFGCREPARRGRPDATAELVGDRSERRPCGVPARCRARGVAARGAAVLGVAARGAEVGSSRARGAAVRVSPRGASGAAWCAGRCCVLPGGPIRFTHDLRRGRRLGVGFAVGPGVGDGFVGGLLVAVGVGLLLGFAVDFAVGLAVGLPVGLASVWSTPTDSPSRTAMSPATRTSSPSLPPTRCRRGRRGGHRRRGRDRP